MEKYRKPGAGGGEEAIHRRGRGYLQEAKAKVRLDVKLDRLLG